MHMLRPLACIIALGLSVGSWSAAVLTFRGFLNVNADSAPLALGPWGPMPPAPDCTDDFAIALGASANVVLHQPMPVRDDGLTNPRIGAS
jgi:hypothetical protein